MFAQHGATLEMQQPLMLVKIDQSEDYGDDLYDLSDAPRRRQQPDQIEDQKKDGHQ
jgi:hypothetical protein